MKKIFILYGVLIVIVIALLIWKAGASSFSFFGPKASTTINNKTISLQIADSEQERMRGLSGKKSLNDDNGMLFLFDKKDKYQFWMKDMNFPIDIIYLDTDRVVDIIKNAPPATDGDDSPTIYQPNAPANRVLEVPAGFAERNKVTVGSKLTFKGVN